MRDVSAKPETLRIAHAEAILQCLAATIRALKEGNVPKADPLGVAKVAGVQAAKNTSLLIPYCHQVPLDYVGVDISLMERSIQISTEVKAVWKTGVEMEALTAAAASALGLYDMLKPIDGTMMIGPIRLIDKKGGKSDRVPLDLSKFRGAVLVISDRAARGQMEDRSGVAAKERMTQHGLVVAEYKIIPDEAREIEAELCRLCDTVSVDLVITTGGTGLGPRDGTPEATSRLLDRTLPGVSEMLRAHGQERNRSAMLSRGVAGVRGKTVIVNLPGSVDGVNESMDVLFPWLFHAFDVMADRKH
jgi:cyclic pyranopterin monophosphate synthase